METSEVKSLKKGTNELPDEVLLQIISLLPLKEAVRTSVLSKRWRYLYASIPNLDFDFGELPVVNQLNFLGFVDRLFFLRGRTVVEKFNLRCWDAPNVDAVHLEWWISSIIELGIQEILIHFDFNKLLPTSRLFTCATLTSLKLYFMFESSLQVPANILLPSLKILHLVNSISFCNDDSAERLFSNCPVLEDLEIRSLLVKDGKCNLTVPNSTLKRLTIVSLLLNWDQSFDIVIDAPNLVYLKYNGCDQNSHVFVNVQSLSAADINFWESLCPQSNPHSASDLMRGICNVETLCLTSIALCSFEKLRVPIPLFINLTHLRISQSGCIFSFLGLPNFLAQSCCLETLVLEMYAHEALKWNPNPWYELRESGASCLLCLKTIEVRSFVGAEDEVKMVEYFLESARVLEQLKIQIKAKPADQSKIADALRSLPRVSQKCRVIIE
ncbi:hypothetical protein SLE2022_044580 [Rubroshorea leprosula]